MKKEIFPRPEENQVEERRFGLVAVFDGILKENIFRLLMAIPLAATGWVFGLASLFHLDIIITAIVVLVVAYYVFLIGALAVGYQMKKRELLSVQDDLQVMQEESDRLRSELSRLGTNFAGHIRKLPEYYSITEWVECMQVRANGDTTITRTTTLWPGKGGIDLSFQNLFSNDVTNEGDVTVTASILATNEDGKYIAGKGGKPSMEGVSTLFNVWEEQGKKLSSFILLPEHYPANHLVTVRTKWEWKGYSKSLMEEGTDTHKLTMSRACQRYKQTISIERAGIFKESSPFLRSLSLVEEGKINCKLENSVSDDGQFIIITCEAHNIKPGNWFGFRVTKLKDGDD